MFRSKLIKGISKIFDVDVVPRKKQWSNGESTFIINEAINFESQAIFIAIPKTGTTSVRTQMRQSGYPMIDNYHLNIVQIRDMIYPYLLKKNLGTNNHFPNVNVKSDEDIRKEAKEIFENFFKFSAVRNPWARAVSLYFRREGVKTKGNMTFEEFCENHFFASDTCHQPTLHRNQCDWLVSEDGKILMDYIYKVEEFEKAIDEVRELTNGRIILESVERNVNPSSKSRDYRSLFSDNTRNLIAKRFEKDIDLFKYTF